MAAAHKNNDTQFENWIKGALALLYAKKGLEQFVIDELIQFQKDLLSSICQNEALPMGTVCNSCTTENVLPCPTKNFCTRGNVCRVHDLNDSNRIPNQQCPNLLCNNIREGILREHRYHGPSWKNTNALKWCVDVFEIAKCYMPPDGYSDVTTFVDTDFNGILAVIINNKRFKNKLDNHYKQPNDACIMAREEVSHNIRHSPDLSVSDNTLLTYIDALIRLLTDSKHLLKDTQAQKAVANLVQLKSNTLSISRNDITAVLDEAIRRKELTALQAIKTGKDEAIDQLGEQTIQILKNAKASASNIQTITSSSLDQISTEAQSSIDEIRKEANKQKQDMATAAAMEREKIQLGRTDIEELEKTMKDDLITVYKKHHSKIPITPLIEEHDVPLADFYVQPPLTSIDIKRRFGQQQKLQVKTPIFSLSELFEYSNGEMYKDIYISAQAGIGKTSFVNNICMIWCQAHRPVKSLETKYKLDDIHLMKKFEFLFMVSFRDIYGSVCDLDEIIDKCLLRALANRSQYSRYVLESIFKRNNCLVILDGLDEWSHPLECSKRSHIHEIPHIPARERCTIITTSRPWKLDVVKLHTGQMDRHIEIDELNESASKMLIKNAISVLNMQSSSDHSKCFEQFELATSSEQLENLRYIPYILLQIICLWYDGKSFGKSKHEMYTNIITLILSRGFEKLERKGMPVRIKQSINNTSELLPTSLQSNSTCMYHSDVLHALSKLGFEKLFSSKKETALTFDKADVLCYFSEDILKLCLEIGFLSQKRDYTLVSERRSTISFQHKSIQEYFAALYIHAQICQCYGDLKDCIRNECGTLPDILDKSNVFIFLSGLSPVGFEKIFKIFEYTISSDPSIEYFRNSDITCRYYVPNLLEYWNLMKSWQSFLADSIIEIDEQNVDIFISDILIDSTVPIERCEILKRLTKNKRERVKSLSMLEFQSTEEFTCKLKTLDLQDTHGLQKLVIEAVPETIHLNSLLLGSVKTLSCLIIDFTEFKENVLCNAITEVCSETISILTCMSNLRILSLDNMRLKHDDIQHFFKFVMSRDTITLIRLWDLNCSDHGRRCDGFCLDLSKRKKIEVLQLSNLPTTMLLADLTFLERCAIGQLRTDVLSVIVKLIPEAKNLSVLDFCGFQPEQSGIIVDTLSKLKKLQTISVQHCNLVDTILTLPPEMIHLELLLLYDVSMSCDSLNGLISSINILPQQVELNLEGCDVMPLDAYEKLREEIKVSSKFKLLFDGITKSKMKKFTFQTQNVDRD